MTPAHRPPLTPSNWQSLSLESTFRAPPRRAGMALSSSLADALSDRYTLERQIGRGGMATVYLARDLKHDRVVALKVLHPELSHTLGPDRFLREIRTAARLQNPHILAAHASGASAGHL